MGGYVSGPADSYDDMGLAMKRKLLAGFAAAGLALSLAAPPSGADTVGPINFETYALGAIWGQQGWTGGICGPHDIAVTDNTLHAGDPASFGAKSYRISNAVTNGCFGDSFSPSVVNAAGEATAQASPLSGGTRQPMYVTEFAIASSTGGYQPGLAIQVSPDRGDGARMSYLRARHGVNPDVPAGGSLYFDFMDVQGVVGTAPCFQCANFQSETSGPYNPAVAHTVRLEMRLLPGPSNDVVRVFIDGVLKHTGTSWEDYYYLDTESSPNPPRVSRTADSLLIRASGSATPALSGNGFLIDGLKVQTGPLVPYKGTELDAYPIVVKIKPLQLTVLVGLKARLTSGGQPVQGEVVKFYAGGPVNPTFLCQGTTNTNGEANCAKFLSQYQVKALIRLGYLAKYLGDETYFATEDRGTVLQVS